MEYFHHPRQFPSFLSSKTTISLLPEGATAEISITKEQFCLFQTFVYMESYSVDFFLSGFFFAQHSIFEIHPVLFFFFIVHQASHCMHIPQFVIQLVVIFIWIVSSWCCEHSYTSHFVDIGFFYLFSK